MRGVRRRGDTGYRKDLQVRTRECVFWCVLVISLALAYVESVLTNRDIMVARAVRGLSEVEIHRSEVLK